jgi:FimV-like protein
VEEHRAFEPTPSAANAIPAAESGSTAEPLHAASRENIGGATTAASLQAAAEFGAEALPLTPLEPVDEAVQQEEPAHRLQWDDEPAPSASTASREPAPASQGPQQHTLPPVIYFTQQPIESRPPAPGQPNRDVSANPQPAETSVQAQPASAAPTEFPRDAVDAFNSLDMPLPPRVDLPAESAQPGTAPEPTTQQVAPHDPDDAETTPHIADEIATGTAAHAAIAGLGGAGFGALKLDFDLELPPSPAQPLPAFTQADLVRIARNKLDLASEYIELGDLSGARALINEVIEANDPATRTQARALLLTLAPLS